MRDLLNKLQELSEADLSHREAQEVIKRAATRRNKSLFSFRKVSQEELLQAWKEDGYPTDLDELIQTLKPVGIGKREVKKMLKKMGIDREVGSDKKVTALANAIKSAKLDYHVLKYIEKQHPKLKESVLLEKQLSDASIRELFTQISDARKGMPASDNARTYMKDWASEFESQSDSGTKVELIRELVNFLADRKGQTDAEELKGTATQVIRKSNLPKEVIASALNNIKSGSSFTKPSVRTEPNTSEPESEPDQKLPPKDRAPAQVVKGAKSTANGEEYTFNGYTWISDKTKRIVKKELRPELEKNVRKPKYRMSGTTSDGKPKGRRVEATEIEDLQKLFDSAIMLKTYGRGKR